VFDILGREVGTEYAGVLSREIRGSCDNATDVRGLIGDFECGISNPAQK
jgi:hypothetical protein